MPTFSTGNTAWDQGLGNLSGALFPDPSKVAQAGYYGAEQRNAQLRSSQLRDQMARQQVLDQAANTGTMPPETYAPSPEGPNMPPIMQPPGSAAPPSLSAAVAPGSAAAAPPPPAPAAATPAAPTAAPPPSLSGLLAGNRGPAAPAAPAAGTVGANMAPGGLSALFAGGGGAVPDGGGTVRLDQGTPPPVSSPAQGSGAPPAPNNTASDGSVPTNDAVSGVFHPGSVTPPGGGTKVTGPANANGSPAQPMITAAQYVNLAVSAGRDANQALLQWRSMISTMYDTGRIDENTYHHMMGSADPSIINQDTQSRTSITTTGMTNQTSRDVAGIQAGSAANVANIQAQEADKARGDALVDTKDEQGNKTFTPRRDLKPGQPGYDATLANTKLSATVAPVQVQPDGPGGPTFSETTETAQKNRDRLYQPTSTDQFTAAQQQQIVNEHDPAKRQALIESFTSAQTAMPKPTDANESVRNSNIIDRQLQTQIPVPVIPLSQGGGMHTNTNPAGASPELSITLQNLTDQYFTYSPDRAIRGNRVAAANAAIQQLIRDKYINTDPNARAGGWTPGSITATTINKPVFNKDGSVTPTPHFRVDIVDPNNGGKPFASGHAPNIPMAMSSVVTPSVAAQAPAPAATSGPAVPPVPPPPVAPQAAAVPPPPAAPQAAAVPSVTPPGAIAQAPPGTPDGKRATVPGTNQVGVVRGGWVFAQ